ncbi:MAG: ParB/RepB/Spo0J family partition protein [Phycisphaerales bacterium]|nr:ParB/RepB/Spo0J family partition protein [Phycisphaerales bacterium]
MKVAKKSRRVPALIRMLFVDRLVPTPDNRRRPITQASVESLARSLAKDGVLQPIVVRPHAEKDGWFEIRAGERRWRAAKLAGLKEMPAVVRTLDDESALSVTIAENLQREGLHPLEEAATIQQAFDRGYDLRAVAARLGKSPAYIARRASLSKLSKLWRDEILKPETEASRLSVAHLELIARLPEETQESLAEESFRAIFDRGFPTVEELRRIIDGGLQSLRSMPWPLDDETIDPKAGSCLNCPKRSGQHPMLFAPEDAPVDGRVSKTDRCLDPACYDRKRLAFVERRETELRGSHPGLRLVQLGYDRLQPRLLEKFGDRLTLVYNPKFVKPTAEGATPVMQVDGPKAGRLMHVALEASANRALNGRKPERPRGADGKPVPMPLAERRARLQKRRDAFLVQKVGEQLRSMSEQDLLATAGKFGTRTDSAAKRFNPLALVLAFGTSTRADRDHDDGPWKRYEELIDRKAEVPLVAALQEVVQVWVRRLGGSDTHHTTEQAADARRVCELLGIDSASIEAEAARVIPTPKGWASHDDGPKVVEEPPFDPDPPANGKAGRSGKPLRPKRRRPAR